MIRRSFALFLLFGFLLAVPIAWCHSSQRPATADSTVTSEQKSEFLRLANEWKDAYNAQDGARLGALYTPDADYVSPHVVGIVAHGRENIRKNFERGMKGGGHIDAIEILSCSMSCDMACVVARYDATNSGQKVNGRNVIILRNIGGRWLFATHASIVQ